MEQGKEEVQFSGELQYFELLFFCHLGQTNLIPGSMDLTDPIFAECRKKKQPKNFYMHVKKVK